mmetsp:Transcript_24141/g.32144  ORF Transcript_24141/g.32144 Transcript_24141/m.32144 type:complete len:593 (-) Transcript_24141:238-2016(-)
MTTTRNNLKRLLLLLVLLTSQHENIVCHAFVSPISSSFMHHRPSSPHHHLPKNTPSSQYMSSTPSESEKNAQKLEAIQSLSEYNDGTWKGQSTSFSITADVASGITKRKISKPYTTSVSARMSVSGGLTLVETLQWEGGKGKEGSEGSCVATRTSSLGASSDIDSVDGSYSIDVSLLDLPKFLTGTETICKFAIEKCLATSEEERVRCFLLYGMDDTLFRVVVCHEERVKEEEEEKKKSYDRSYETNDSDFSSSVMDEDEEMAADIERLVGKITGEITDDDDKDEPKIDSSSSSVPKVPGPITADTPIEERMELLQNALAKAKLGGQGDDNISLQNKDSTEGGDVEKTMVLSPVSLYDLSLGVWLGDAVVRDQMITNTGIGFGKGFGGASGTKSSSKAGKSKISSSSSTENTNNMGDGFAEWSMGVQKVAMTYRWNFDDLIRQKFDFGRSMGAYTSDDLPRNSMGNVVLDESMSRRIKAGERITYIDYDMGAYAGFFVGSVCIKAPKYLNFSQNGRAQSRPFYTEFAVFHKTVDKGTASSDNTASILAQQFDENSIPPELYCSRMTRLYSIDGRLSQGSTSFFTLKRMSRGE